ncbi:hypothetical protein [Devosia indica]
MMLRVLCFFPSCFGSVAFVFFPLLAQQNRTINGKPKHACTRTTSLYGWRERGNFLLYCAVKKLKKINPKKKEKKERLENLLAIGNVTKSGFVASSQYSTRIWLEWREKKKEKTDICVCISCLTSSRIFFLSNFSEERKEKRKQKKIKFRRQITSFLGIWRNKPDFSICEDILCGFLFVCFFLFF